LNQQPGLQVAAVATGSRAARHHVADMFVTSNRRSQYKSIFKWPEKSMKSTTSTTAPRRGGPLRSPEVLHLPAKFIYAGIDVERCGVFTGTRGRQLAGRCELICTGAFPYREEWVQLIAALEATLPLHHHEPGALPPRPSTCTSAPAA
jgi:hypothetical protein